MNEAQAAAETVKTLANGSNDPVSATLLTVLGGVILLIAIGGPIMGLYRDYKKNNAENSRSDAESLLYQQLQQQMTSNSDAIIKLQNERNEWFSKAVALEHEVQKLKTFEIMVNGMKDRLNDKDRVIEERDKEIRNLTRTILGMKDQLHALEMRLNKDEQEFCQVCKFKERHA